MNNRKIFLFTGLGAAVLGIVVLVKQNFLKTSSLSPEDRDSYQAPIYRGPVDPPGTTFGGKNKKQKTKNKKKKSKKANTKSK